MFVKLFAMAVFRGVEWRAWRDKRCELLLLVNRDGSCLGGMGLFVLYVGVCARKKVCMTRRFGGEIMYFSRGGLEERIKERLRVKSISAVTCTRTKSNSKSLEALFMTWKSRSKTSSRVLSHPPSSLFNFL